MPQTRRTTATGLIRPRAARPCPRPQGRDHEPRIKKEPGGGLPPKEAYAGEDARPRLTNRAGPSTLVRRADGPGIFSSGAPTPRSSRGRLLGIVCYTRRRDRIRGDDRLHGPRRSRRHRPERGPAVAFSVGDSGRGAGRILPAAESRVRYGAARSWQGRHILFALTGAFPERRPQDGGPPGKRPAGAGASGPAPFRRFPPFQAGGAASWGPRQIHHSRRHTLRSGRLAESRAFWYDGLVRRVD